MPTRPPTHRPHKAPGTAAAERGTACERGYDRRWRKARRVFLARADNALCAECRHEVATVVDHRTPHKGDDRLFWDEANWQALCKACHDSKTAKTDGGFGRGR